MKQRWKERKKKTRKDGSIAVSSSFFTVWRLQVGWHIFPQLVHFLQWNNFHRLINIFILRFHGSVTTFFFFPSIALHFFICVCPVSSFNLLFILSSLIFFLLKCSFFSSFVHCLPPTYILSFLLKCFLSF